MGARWTRLIVVEYFYLAGFSVAGNDATRCEMLVGVKNFFFRFLVLRKIVDGNKKSVGM